MKERLEYGNRTLDDLAFLDGVTKRTLRDFVERLKKAEGDNLAQVALFGSRARGDFDEDSDTDVFVLLWKDVPRERYNAIIDLSVDVSEESGFIKEEGIWQVDVNPFIKTVEELDEEYHNVPMWRLTLILYEIQEDGVLLYDATGYRQDGADTVLSGEFGGNVRQREMGM